MRFFKQPKHQKFKYVPRFYDPDKEDLQQRLQKARQEQEHTPEAMKSRISSGLRSYRAGNGELRRKSVIKSNMVVVFIVIILIILTYFFIIHYLPKIFEAFG
jgi:hypothetical protein